MGERRGWNWRRVLLVVVVLVVVNLPYLLHVWQVHRAQTSGVQVTATVVGITPSGDNAVVAFRLPKSVDPAQELRTVEVDGSVGAQAARTRELEVSVLSGNPGVFHVDGQVRSWSGLIVTLVADLLIITVLLLLWRLGGRIRRPALEAVAIGDVETGAEGSVLDKQDDGTYVINGEVAEAGEHSLVLRLRDRDVTIHLHDHRNPLSVGDRAQVRAQLVG
ncbi:MAG: hypothetical protein J2P22_11030 [Nocardioides sp.]|nr:hypothetical protein [Nocardioides sp.]